MPPDAWDDDWESQADRAEQEEPPALPRVEPARVSKAERLAQHAETNKKIWESAESPPPRPESFHFLAARDDVPLKSDFKPALRVLSRKPTPRAVRFVDPVTGMVRLQVEDEEDEDEGGVQLSPGELRVRAQMEREQKQRRYDEARARILGTSATLGKDGNNTPPDGEATRPTRGKGGKRRGGINLGSTTGRSDSARPSSQSGNRELFDPKCTPKPNGITIQRRDGEGWSPGFGGSTSRYEEQVIREPKGPDRNARGGFGFTKRGGEK